MLTAGCALGDAVLIEQAKDGRLVQTGAVAPPDFALACHDDRPAPRRADDRSETATFAIVEDGTYREREFTGLAAELAVTPTAMGREPRNADPLQQFPWRERVLERPGDELFDGKPAETAGSRDHALRAERAECRDPVRGRIGVANAAADRAAVAHRPVSNAPGYHRQGLQAPARQAAVLDVRRRNAGTERHRIVAI